MTNDANGMQSKSQSDSGKKGRPTPKRKDVEATRKVSSLAPASTKAEKARAKEAAKVARIAQRAAYLRGDENALPARDRGVEKRFIRDLVDSRRSIGEYFLPIIGIVLVISMIPNKIAAAVGIIIMYSVLLFSIIDGFFLSKKIKKEVIERFPGKSTKGLGMYGWLRSTQMRRMRAPKPSKK
jgi:hypothetical protein